MAKINKSLRLDEEVVALVESFGEKDFTKCFDALVRAYFIQQPEIQANIDRLEARKLDLINQVQDLTVMARDIQKVTKTALSVLTNKSYEVDGLVDAIDRGKKVALQPVYYNNSFLEKLQLKKCATNPELVGQISLDSEPEFDFSIDNDDMSCPECGESEELTVLDGGYLCRSCKHRFD